MMSEETISLPNGWVKRITKRKIGKNVLSIRTFVRLVPPNGKQIRSTNDLVKFIVENPHVPLDPKYVNMEADLFHCPEKLKANTKKFIDFVECFKRGDPNALATFNDNKQGPKKKSKLSNTSSPKKSESDLKLESEQSQDAPGSQTNGETPFKTKFSIPCFTMIQAIKLEKLLLDHPGVPDPNQISLWSDMIGISVVNLLQWIHLKEFISQKLGQDYLDQDVLEKEIEMIDPSVLWDYMHEE